MTTWNKRLRPVAAVVALLTVVGLFGAGSANASNTAGKTTSGGYAITVKPYDSEQSLNNVIVSARPIDSDMARQACENAKVTPPASLPGGLMSLPYSNRMIVASAMMNQSTLPAPSATRIGEGTLKVPTKGLWLVSSQFGFAITKAPGNVNINGYMKTGDSLSKREVQKLNDVKAAPSGQTDVTPSAFRNATPHVRNATLIERKGSRKSAKMADYNTYNDTQVNPVSVGRKVQWADPNIMTHYFTWGGHPVICQDPAKYPPDNGATYEAYTWMNNPSVGGDLKRAFYYGYGGPGNIFQNPDDALIATHYVVASKLRHPVPESVKTSRQYQALMDIADHGATGVEQTEIIQLHPVGNANPDRQWLIFAIFHSYNISATTQAQTRDNYTAPWVNGGTTADGKYIYGGIDHDWNVVRDTVTVTVHDGIKPTGATFNIDYWLHCETADGKEYMVKKSQTDQLSGVIWQNQSVTLESPLFTSNDLWGENYWPTNATFYFDVNVMRGNNNDATTWPGSGMVQTFGKNDKNESWRRKSTDLTVATEARYYDANGNWAMPPTLNGSQSVLDRLSITPKDQWLMPDEALVYRVTLNYDYDKNGTVDKSATKTTIENTDDGWAGGQIHEADSDKFTAVDLGLKGGWKPGDYWFDVTVFRLYEGAAPSLSKDSYVHEGKDDPWESFSVSPAPTEKEALPAVSTKVTADTARDGKPVKDRVTVTMLANRTDFKVSGVTVKARGTLYWSRTKGTKGGSVPADAKKIADLTPLTFTSDMLADGHETLTYDPAADNALKAVGAQSRLGTGYYTYVWRIDKSDLKGQTATLTWGVGPAKITQTETTDVLFRDMKDTVPDGWKPGAEQTTMDATWTPAIHKVGHVGGADGNWMDARPAANAILNMAETTDATGRALAPTAQTSQIQLKQDGTGVFPTQVIGMGQTRYYKIWESRVGRPFNVPKNGAYWMVTAKQVPGTTGVQLTVTGSSDETRWLVRTWSGTDNGSSAGSGLKNNPVDWKVTLGDTLDANVTPPSTGGTADTLRMWAVIAAATGLAAAGALTAVTRRSSHTGRHSA
ncbi:hypothetical protein ACLUWS_03365 [Bifidobacterium boum]|uniref:hypothetical protein n=1 Tax=Bifidobacterium boum TaxID=78343 RepID=UPI003995FBAE